MVPNHVLYQTEPHLDSKTIIYVSGLCVKSKFKILLKEIKNFIKKTSKSSLFEVFSYFSF